MPPPRAPFFFSDGLASFSRPLFLVRVCIAAFGHKYAQLFIFGGPLMAVESSSAAGSLGYVREQRNHTQMQANEAGSKRTILIVDDYEAVRSIVGEFLESQGFLALPATTSSEALRIAEAYIGDIDILLMAARMPDISGLVLAERLKSLRPKMAVIIMPSALDDASDKHLLDRIHARLLWKPFTNGELLHKIRDLMP